MDKKHQSYTRDCTSVFFFGGGLTPYSLYILQSARVRFQGGGVLHHLVHGDDQEDEIELSKQSNDGVNTLRCMSQHTADREGKTVNLPLSIKRGGALTSLHVHRLIQ